tara:strand:- start:496 stop:1197 length:702 start_codon:yes stop_codon:yes gene_type:complete
MKKLLYLLLFTTLYSYSQKTISNTFTIPKGYERLDTLGYSKWIINQTIKLNEKVFMYDGSSKPGLNYIYIAKFDYNIGTKDLHHCADAAIYNNAKYLYDSGQYSKIKYHFTNGKLYSYNKKDFIKYIEKIWIFAGSWSLKKYDTENVNIKNIKSGDIFIVGGFPGHVVSVVDVVVNNSGHKKYMLSQSYMPAQEQHILLNPKGGIWYDLHLTKNIKTPQYTFTVKQLRRFKNK